MSRGRGRPRSGARARRAGGRSSAARLAALAVAGCLATLAGCGEDDGQEAQKFDPFAAVPAAPRDPQTRNRAAPRWEPIASFSGSGPATKAFTVARGAIQWRARWRCESGDLRLTVTPPPREGGELAKRRCPAKGTSTAIQTGPLRLGVEASGRWRVVVEQQVDTAIHEPPLRGMTEAARVARGSFFGIERAGKGEASVYRLPSGRLALRLARFSTAGNPGLFVWVSRAPRPRTTKEAFRAPHTNLGPIKSTLGDQNYLLPAGLDADGIRSVVIWCEPIRIAYTAAALGPAAGR